MTLTELAARNFWRHKRRYQVLLTLVAWGSGLSLLLLAGSASISQTLEARAELYFGGDVAIVGQGPARVLENEAAVRAALEPAGAWAQPRYRRTVSYDRETVLFFADNALKQRRIIGSDLAVEQAPLAALDFLEGNAAGLANGGILISQGTARRLGARTGDEVTLLLDTVKGAKNTVRLPVSGVFDDTSFFGFSSYVSLPTLNRALGLPAEAITELGFRGGGTDAASRLASLLNQKALKGTVVTLDTRLEPIQNILDAVSTVSSVLNVLFIVIVALGVGNTFRAVLTERTREIGVMRALGMTRARLLTLMVTEAATLSVAGGLLGTLGGTVVWTVLTWIDWGPQPLASLFLTRGHLAWVFPWDHLYLPLAITLAAGLLGALIPAVRALLWKPVNALRYHS